MSCQEKELQKVDYIINNATIYTVDSAMSIVQSMAITNGKIEAVGTNEEISEKYFSEDVRDFSGKYIYPGLIDAHCHFFGYGLNKVKRADLSGLNSKQEVLTELFTFSRHNMSSWLEGRGWDQNTWENKSFPNKHDLDSLFADIPVYLIRVDGHAAWVNSKALELAQITKNTKVEGGEVLIENGEPSGILLDKAMDLVRNLIPEPNEEMKIQALKLAQEDCFSVGLTSLGEAGLSIDEIHLIDSLQKGNQLKMRIYVMLEVTESKDLNPNIEKIKTERLNFRSLKMYADGALGSRGALLLKPYSDAKSQQGIQVATNEFINEACNFAYANGFQLNAHAIGDSAVRILLNSYGNVLKEKNDLRWRIEHSQIVDENDFELYGKYSIIPSVQPTHATSDMFWADERLGNERIKNAYAYKKLLEENGWIAGGSDFPIENINPLLGFYAAVFRVDSEGKPDGGFQMENALTREEALKAMTIWAAKVAFEENEKGSLEAGKFADFVVYDKDFMTIPAKEIPELKTLKTFLSGKEIFSKF